MRGAVLCACAAAAAALSSTATKPPPAKPDAPPAACYPQDLPMAASRGGAAQVHGPNRTDASSVAVWLAAMKAMRSACAAAVGYDGSVSRIPQLEWTKTAFISPQMVRSSAARCRCR